MNLQDKKFWAQILLSISAGILTYIFTEFLELQLLIAVFLISVIVASYFLLSDRIANWRGKRSRESREKTILQLKKDLSEVEILQKDLSKLLSRIAWDLLHLQITVIIVAALIVFAILISPSVLEKPSYIVGGFTGFVFGLLNQIKEFRYIWRVYDFEIYKDKVNAKLENLGLLNSTELLTTNRWILVHNPPDKAKTITFLQNGAVGEGQNQNESTWRVKDGKLELLQIDGRTHSRFDFDKKATRFNHTNDRDTLSNRNQFIVLSGDNIIFNNRIRVD